MPFSSVSPGGDGARPAPAVHYAGGPAAEALFAAPDHVLGVIGYGAARPDILPAACPFIAAPLRPVAAAPAFEIWTTDAAVTAFRAGPVAGARSAGLAFGCIHLEERPGGAFEDSVERAYVAIFDFLAQSGLPQPIRFWNYLTAILADERGLERYRRFNIGRHRAFLARLTQAVPPAASCVGGQEGGSVIYFLSAPAPARPVENPRQVSAYDYPPQYGPRSPSFSRAGVHGGTLFVSGTASITGHETRHAGDLRRQVQESLENLRAVITNAGPAPFTAPGAWAFKIYLRAPADIALVAPILDEAFGPHAQKLYLHGEVCRPDLLIEIEAFFSG